MNVHMPPGPASPACHSTLMQFAAYIIKPSSYLDQQFMRQTIYRVTNTKFPFFFFSQCGEMFLNRPGRDPNQLL